MELGIKDKVAIVTGSSKGIGLAVAESLAGEGAIVVLAARSERDLDKAVEKITRQGGSATGIITDMTRPEEIKRLAKKAIDTYGNIHILVNNVGGMGAYAPFEELSDDEWLQTFEINVMAAVRMVRAVLPSMQSQHWGRIVNIGSDNGAQPENLAPHYSVAKAGILAFSKSLSKAYTKDGILTNTVSPAMVLTPHAEAVFAKMAAASGRSPKEEEREFIKTKRAGIVVGRSGKPEEVAAVTVFLCSELSSFVTGANYRVDGGAVGTL